MKKQLRTEIAIDAPPERVWAVLTDFERYGEWNPFVPSLQGELSGGSRLRVRLTGDALDDAGITHDELLLGGADPLDALLRACYLGDWVSLYLAMLNGADPTPIGPIDKLKAELARHG